MCRNCAQNTFPRSRHSAKRKKWHQHRRQHKPYNSWAPHIERLVATISTKCSLRSALPPLPLYTAAALIQVPIISIQRKTPKRWTRRRRKNKQKNWRRRFCRFVDKDITHKDTDCLLRDAHTDNGRDEYKFINSSSATNRNYSRSSSSSNRNLKIISNAARYENAIFILFFLPMDSVVLNGWVYYRKRSHRLWVLCVLCVCSVACVCVR